VLGTKTDRSSVAWRLLLQQPPCCTTVQLRTISTSVDAFKRFAISWRENQPERNCTIVFLQTWTRVGHVAGQGICFCTDTRRSWREVRRGAVWTNFRDVQAECSSVPCRAVPFRSVCWHPVTGLTNATGFMATCDTGVTSAVAQLWSPEANYRYATRITLPRCLYWDSRSLKLLTYGFVMRKRGYFTCCLLHMNSGEHAAKTYGEWRLTPHILNLSTRWTWVVTFTPRERVPSWVGPTVHPMVWGTDSPALHGGPSQRLNKGWRRAWPQRQMGVCSTVSGGSLLSQQVYTGVWCVPLFECDVTLWLVNYCSSAEVQSERWHESVTLW